MIKRFTLFLAVALTSLAAFAQNPAPCSELFFSQYVEGTGNNKALEIYNPTTGTVDLSNYKVWISYNGGNSTSSILLQGTLAAGSTFVLVKDSAAPALLAFQNQTTPSLNFNGNDAVTLINMVTLDTLDVIGVVGENPGTAWYTANNDSTHDLTLIRDGSIHNGNLAWDGNNGASFEWLATPLATPNDYSGLGDHTMTPCGVSNDPIVSFAVTSQNVSEDAGTVQVNVSITYPNANPTDVSVVDLGGTATAGTDYTFTASTVSFPGGSGVVQSVAVNIVDDALEETDEYFVLQLQNVTNSGTIATVLDTVHIVDNDFSGIAPVLQLYTDVTSFPENTPDSIVILSVLIGAQNANPTSVTVSVQPQSTATIGEDYSFIEEQTVTFPGGSAQLIPLVLTIHDDLITEPNEDVVISLSNPTNNATIAAGLGSVTINILDNDPTVISELKTLGMNAWPNPASDRCTVSAAETVQRCNVFSANGQLVSSTEPFANRFTVQLDQLPSGLYVIEAVTTTGTLHYRLMKK